jgi:predicted  nucleic acid-binding Zn-ribbon protein
MYTDKNVFVLRQEVERLTYETKKQFEELQQLTKRLQTSEKDNEGLRSKFENLKKASNKTVNMLKQQVVGAVRRVNYLAEEKERLVKDNAKNAKYTAKLELKIVQENLNNKGLR